MNVLSAFLCLAVPAAFRATTFTTEPAFPAVSQGQAPAAKPHVPPTTSPESSLTQMMSPDLAWRSARSNRLEGLLGTMRPFTASTPVPSTTTRPQSLAGANCAWTGATTAPAPPSATHASQATLLATTCASSSAQPRCPTTTRALA